MIIIHSTNKVKSVRLCSGDFTAIDIFEKYNEQYITLIYKLLEMLATLLTCTSTAKCSSVLDFEALDNIIKKIMTGVKTSDLQAIPCYSNITVM